jgi:hypothetical protein
MRSSPKRNSVVVVAGLLHLGRDFDEVWEVVHCRDVLALPAHDVRGLLRGVERQAALLEREAVDVGVHDRVGVHRVAEGEAAFAQASHHRIVVADVRRPGTHAALHEADRPAVPVERGAH